jgi:hypothetical protein
MICTLKIDEENPTCTGLTEQNGFARYEHTRGIKGYVTYYLACLCEFTTGKHAILYEITSAKHAWVSLEKIWMGQMRQTGGKI